jgi:hypothetical protein
MTGNWFIAVSSVHDHNYFYRRASSHQEGPLNPFELLSVRTGILSTTLIRQRSHFDLRGVTSTPHSTHSVCSDNSLLSRIQDCRCRTDCSSFDAWKDIFCDDPTHWGRSTSGSRLSDAMVVNIAVDGRCVLVARANITFQEHFVHPAAKGSES